MDAGGSVHTPELGRRAARTAGRRPRGTDRVFKWVAAVAGAALVGFVVFVIVRGPSQPPEPGSAALESPPPPTLRPGTAAPAFSLPPLGGGGVAVSLASFQGMPVIVNFFASWCPDCRAELDAMATVAHRSAGHVAVIGVDSNESSDAAAKQLLTAAHATYPVGLDNSAKVATRYLINALPVSYFVNAQGRVRRRPLGPQTVTALQRWVARLGGGR